MTTPVLDPPPRPVDTRPKDRVIRSASVEACAAGLAERLDVLRATRRAIAERPDPLLTPCRLPWRNSDAETLVAEALPLCDAIAWLERNARRVLLDRRLGRRGRPAWLWGVSAELRREPVGRVLIVAPANYPLLLAGVQVVQAYAAGNRVAVKPAPGTRGVMDAFVGLLRRRGASVDAVEVLDEDPAEATRRVEAGEVDKAFLTGSDRTGRAVMRLLADHGVPSVMELSGCDALFVLPDADLDRVVAALRFGLRFNGSQTCIAPRRVLVDASRSDELCERAGETVDGLTEAAIPAAAVDNARARVDEALSQGAAIAAGEVSDGPGFRPVLLRDVTPDMAVAREDLFAPIASIIRCDDEAAMLDAYGRCAYRLGTSVFGHAGAAALAARLDAGQVVVNDLIAPTADPRLPFSARGRSGFGTTRAAEGLLEMTQVKAVFHRRGGLTAHLDEPADTDDAIARALLRAGHARRGRDRLAGFVEVARLGRRRRSR